MKTLFTTLLILLSYQSVAAPIETSTMKDVFSSAKQKMQDYGANNLLLVFDIDNTLLTANQDFSSYAWGKWQQGLIKRGHPDAITNNMKKFYKMEAILYSLGRMHTPELLIEKNIQMLQELGISIIALTSRGPHMRSSTEREMKSNNISFHKSKLGKGFPGNYIPKYGKGRPVSFQNGIYMTAGQNKGSMLKSLLEKTDVKFKAIIFTDDLLKHVLNVEKTFKISDLDITTFRYGKMDQQMLRFGISSKERVIQQWKKLQSVRSEIFIERP